MTNGDRLPQWRGSEVPQERGFPLECVADGGGGRLGPGSNWMHQSLRCLMRTAPDERNDRREPQLSREKHDADDDPCPGSKAHAACEIADARHQLLLAERSEYRFTP